CAGGEASLRDCAALTWGNLTWGNRTWGNRTCDHSRDAGVVCSGAPQEGPQVRLVNGPNRCAGRVEVQHLGRWGTVCDDTWDLADAQVTCRQVRCGPALWAPGGAQFGRGSGEIWLDGTECSGAEPHLGACPALTWGRSDCSHREDAGVVCAGSNLSNHSQVQLVNGPNRCAGRVEVLHLGRWGTVCDDTWDMADAQVTCRYLGCGQAIAAPPRAHFGPGEGPVWLDGLTCTGEEGALDECSHKDWGAHTCDHREDAGVICEGVPAALPGEVQVRLVNGPHRCAGRVEVLHLGRWGTVCDDTWDMADAHVTCRQVRCGPALSAPGGALFGEGAGPIWLDGLRCAGTEPHLGACPARPWGEHTCNHVEDAGAVCAGSGSPGAGPQVRLAGAPDRCAGRVEVLHEHLWGTVCDDTWDLADAQVLCAHLGCGPALEALGGARYGRGSGPIWLDDVTCTGEESDFFQCPARTWGEHNCHHGEDAAVICAG
ncbi:DMBT1 protein, partial [Dasyornis broadbenti]|nr:DMBT1 protein [Dasyornis broadbenti]